VTTPRITLATAAVLAGLTPTIPLLSTPASAVPAGPGWVTGVVVDASGNPVEGALVNVLAPREVPGLEILDPKTDRRAITDDEGRFRVRQDSRGFLVQVCDNHPDAPTSCTSPDQADHLMRYAGPDGQFDSWVLHTHLYDAGSTTLDVGTLEVQDPARIEGTLERASFESVQLMRLNDTVAYDGQTDGNGAFSFEGLVPGRYYVRVTLNDGDVKVRTDVPLRRGATATIHLRGTDGRVDSELRNARGEVLYPNLIREDGVATYPGLRRGTYTLVAKDGDGYGLRTFRVRALRGYDLGRLRLDKPLLTLRGRTAPYAVVEATTSDLCPADDPEKHAGFHEIEQADAQGRYVIRGLVPGDHWMVAADGYPRNHAPVCHEDVAISSTSRWHSIPLEEGHTVTGRLVYAGTDLPVITTVGYQVTYPKGLITNPTREHPTRIRTRGASGEFSISRLSVVFPFQPATPYWLDADDIALDLEGDVDLGDIELVLKGN
jgi:hypothetical protein